MLRLVRTTNEPLADKKSAEHWLASFPAGGAELAQARIVREVRALAQASAVRTPAALEALFHVDAHCAELRETLVGQYVEHSGHSSDTEQRLWQALLDFAQAFELAYAAFAREPRRRSNDSRWQADLPELVARYLDQLAFDARVRMFRYEQWIPGKWRELHDLFSIACAEKIARQRITLAPARDSTSIERKYIALLVLQLGNAGNLKPVHVEWLWRQIGEWCAPLRLKITTRSPTALYLDLRESRGLTRRSSSAAAGEVLFLDTQPLSALLRHYIMAVEHKIRTHPLSANTPRRVERLSVLTKVAGQVDGQFTPVPRRGERTAASGEVEVIIGLQPVCKYLHESRGPRSHELDTLSTFSGTLELAIFGRVRDVDAQRAEMARRRLAQYAAPGGPWQVKDVSATGLRLLAPLTAAQTVTLGTLAALRDTRREVWNLGIVRRIRRLSVERAEVGVQRIADAISVIQLVAETTSITEDGQTKTFASRIFAALFLVLDTPGRGAVQSLIIPRAEYEAARGMRLRAEDSGLALRLGRTIEEQPAWLWIAVEPIARASGSPAPATSATS